MEKCRSYLAVLTTYFMGNESLLILQFGLEAGIREHFILFYNVDEH